MYYYGGGSCCNQSYQPYPMYCGNYGSNGNYAIVLVLFILLVIVIGSRTNR
jgi:hypothetical protein